ncbi:MAG TPA: hypothetical protein VFL57_11670, partial [Bryobacteraceae bacterium]|nr:hypothetical protein [Bryobacteraceae bacterium]
MRIVRGLAVCILLLTCALSLGADLVAPHNYAVQYRDRPNKPPSGAFLLGTDELGRDRFSRFVHGSRVSLVCASAAALVAIMFGAAVGLAGGSGD